MMTLKQQLRRMARGFTLVEILVVLATISIVVALGVPLFNTLTGARSVEAGRNLVAAALGQARTIAVNEGKFAGVLFYIDPATERTAMSIVIVADPRSGLEDPDPYDKYKTWIVNSSRPVEYKAAGVDANNFPIRGDRVIGFSADADSVYRGALYASSNGTGAIYNPMASDYIKYFGNYRPTVRTFRAAQTHTSENTAGVRPPRNGPYGYPGNSITPNVFLWNNGNTVPGVKPTIIESTSSDFGNANWGDAADKIITTYAVGGQQLLPNGIAAQLIVQPITRNVPGPNVGTPAGQFQERYVRTGVVLFDPQGRLSSLRSVVIEKNNALGNTLALNSNAQSVLSAVGIVLYDASLFREAILGDTGLRTTQSDYIYQAVGAGNPYYINSRFDEFFADQENTTNALPEYNEELWIDNNSVPLLINRYSGSLSAID